MENLSRFFSSGYLIFLFLLFVVGVFIGLYLVRYFIPLIFANKINKDRFRQYFTIIEMATWVLLLLFGILFFLKRHIVFAAILLLPLLALLFWWSRFALKDYLAGLIFKIENRFALNEVIEVEGYKGKIKQFYLRNLSLENEDGKLIFIPYAKLMAVVSSPQNITETVLNDNFELTIPDRRSADEVKNLLKGYIMSLPWSISKYNPNIKLIDEIDNHYVFKITLFSFDESYFQLMRKKIKTFVDNEF